MPGSNSLPPVAPPRVRAAAVLALSLVPVSAGADGPARHEVCSPDGRVLVTTETGADTRYSVAVDGAAAVTPSPVSLSLSGDRVFGRGAVTRVDERQGTEEFAMPHGKRARVRQPFREVAVVYAGGATLRARVFDDGCAIRWERDIVVPLGLLGAGRSESTIYADGANASHTATDYRVTTQIVAAATKLPVALKQGGGAVIRVRRLTE
jgi:hypothetical protein